MTAGCMWYDRYLSSSNEILMYVSLSSRTIVYKGMFSGRTACVCSLKDLQDPDYESAIAIVHSRFSTNTNPSWERAHPNRFIVHNGEINTIRGNADKMRGPGRDAWNQTYLKGRDAQGTSGHQCYRF